MYSVFSLSSIVLALTFRLPLVNVCVWCEVGVQLHSFAWGYAVVLVTLVKVLLQS